MSRFAHRGAVLEHRSRIRRRMQRRSGRAAPQLARRPRRPRRYLKPGYSIGVPVLTIILLMAGATGVAAHPLGNFTVNTSSGLRVAPDRLDVDYVVDMAEISAYQTRQAIDTDHDDRVTAPRATAGGPGSAPAWPATSGPRSTAGPSVWPSPGPP